jgi:hypothetical protein
VSDECLSKLFLFGEHSLRRAEREYVAHYHVELNHQGKSNILLFSHVIETRCDRAMECREQLGRVLRCYYRDAACLGDQVPVDGRGVVAGQETDALLMATVEPISKQRRVTGDRDQSSK